MLWNLVLVAPLLFVVSCQQSQKDPNNGNPMVRDPGQTDVEPNNRQQEEGGDQSSQRSAGSILGDSKKEWTGRCKNAGYRYQLVTLPNDTFNIEQIDGGLTGDSASGDIQMDNGVVTAPRPTEKCSASLKEKTSIAMLIYLHGSVIRSILNLKSSKRPRNLKIPSTVTKS